MPKDLFQDEWNSAATVDAQTRTMLTARLRNKIFVLGCGAWQSAWTANSRKIGFEREASISEKPSRLQILESISPEIRQRFRDEVCWLEPMIEGGFVECSANVLAFGLPGRGKTHFLAALGRELILRHSKRVLFRPAFRLVGQLLAAKRDLRLEAELKKLDRFDVLILVDIGYREAVKR